MAKLNLAGDFYTTRAVAAAAQSCVNFYPESIEDPGGSGKNTKILRGTPGYSLFTTLSHGPVRCLWSCESTSGGGRGFAVSGQFWYEFNSAGTIVTSSDLGINSTQPAQMFGNGNQLGIVNGGQFYISNGGAPVKSRFQLNGTVSVVGTAVTWQSGDLFPTYSPSTADPLPTVIFINGNPLTVTFNSSTTATLASALAGGSGVVFREFGDVFWVSGTTFSSTWVGMTIYVNSIPYVIAAVPTQYHIVLTTTPAGIEYPATYAVVIADNTYSTAGGDLVTALTGTYADGTFYVQRPQGGTPDLGRQVNFSAINDGTHWNGLDFFTKEAYPDYIESIMADRGQLYIFGTNSSEVWQNDLNTGVQQRIQGAVAREGSVARFAPVSMQQHIYYLGTSDGGSTVAYRVDGYTPTRISTHAIEEQWDIESSLDSTGDAWGWWYVEDGHYFWVINLAAGASTWVYDATEKTWHQRLGWDGANFGSYLFGTHTFVQWWGTGGLHLVGDRGSAKVYVMRSDIYTGPDNTDIKRVRALPYIYAGMGNRVYVNRVDLNMATGLVPSGAAPNITLEWSADNGATWDAPQSASIGTHGQTDLRVFWIAQGSGPTSLVPRFSITSKAAVTLIDAEAEIWAGDS